MSWGRELPAAPVKKNWDVAAGLGIENGDGLLLMEVPRGSLIRRAAGGLNGEVSVGGRSVEIGSDWGLAVGGVEIALKAGDTTGSTLERAASRNAAGDGGTNMEVLGEVMSEGGRKAAALP